MERMIKTTIRHPRKTNVLETELPASFPISGLQDVVVKSGYAKPYIMGFKFIIANHLLTASAMLENYLPEGADSVIIDIFDIPETTI